MQKVFFRNFNRNLRQINHGFIEQNGVKYWSAQNEVIIYLNTNGYI